MPNKQFASFHIGDNLFGIDVRLIREINRNIDITPVDGAPGFVRGLMNLRGQIVTVVDAGVRMGLCHREDGGEERRCIVLKMSDELDAKRSDDPSLEGTSRDLVALYVDDVGEIVMLDEKDIMPPPANTGKIEGKFISGLATLEKELMIVVKIAELLRNEEEKKQAE
jgi:purine-binding chemotaxis protein CheW